MVRPSTDRFPSISIDQVRAAPARYVVVPRTEWEHSFSHVAGHDEGGWLVAGNQCFGRAMPPGGIAWLAYPDGTPVYLAAP